MSRIDEPGGPDYDLDDQLVTTSADQLRAVADPLRSTLLDLVLERAATVNELAAAVARPKSTVAHHVSVLTAAGLLRVVRTRRVRAIEERFYGRTARTIVISRQLDQAPDGTLPPTLLAEAAAEAGNQPDAPVHPPARPPRRRPARGVLARGRRPGRAAHPWSALGHDGLRLRRRLVPHRPAGAAAPRRDRPRRGVLMAHVLVLHHAQGLTDGVRAFGRTLADDGHDVVVPDLYEGRTFGSVDDGVAYAEEIGFDEIVARASAVADTLPPDLVYIGFSLGAFPAQHLAQLRPGARGAVFLHGGVPTATFSAPWPVDVPLQLHLMADDPLGELDVAHDLDAEIDTAELHVYPGAAHLFTDSSLAEYDAQCAGLVLERVRRWLRNQVE